MKKLRIIIIILAVLLSIVGYKNGFAGRPIPNQFLVEKSLGVNLTNNLFNKISAAIGPLIKNYDFSSIIGTQFSFLGLTITITGIDVNAGGDPYGRMWAEPPDKLKVSVTIPKVKVYVRVTGWDNFDGYVEAKVVVTTEIAAILEDLKLGLLAQNTNTQVTNVQAHFEGGILPDLIEYIINEVANTILQQMVSEMITQELEKMFNGEPLVDLIDIIAPILASAPSFQNSTVDLRTAHSNGYLMSTKLGFFPLVSRGSDIYEQTLPNVLPLYGLNAPYTGNPFHLSLAISDDVINNILFMVSKADMLKMTIDGCFFEGLGFPIPFTTMLLAMIVPEMDELFPESHPILLKLNPLQALKIEVVDSETLIVWLDDFELTWEVVEQGHKVLACAFAIDLGLRVQIHWDSQQQAHLLYVSFVLDDYGLPYIEVQITNRGLLKHTTPEEIKDGLQNLLGIFGELPIDERMLQDILDSLEDMVFMGLTPKVEAILFEGGNTDYLSIYISLSGDIQIPTNSEKKGAKQELPFGGGPIDYLAIANYNAKSVSIFRAFDFWPITSSPIVIGNNLKPRTSLYNPDLNLLYVICDGASGQLGGIAVIDTANWSVVNGTPFGSGAGSPGEMAINLWLKLLYVSNQSNNCVDIYNIRSKAPQYLASINTGIGQPVDVAYDSYRKLLYVANRSDDTLAVYDAAYTIPAYIKNNSCRAAGIQKIGKIEFNQEADLLYILGEDSRNVVALDCYRAPETFPVWNSRYLGGLPNDLTIDTARNLLYVSNRGISKIIQLDAYSLSVLAQSGDGVVGGPDGIRLHPYNIAYSTNANTNRFYLLKADLLDAVWGSPITEPDTGPREVYYFNPIRPDITPPQIGAVTRLPNTNNVIGPYIVEATNVTDNVALDEAILIFETFYGTGSFFYRKEMVMEKCDKFVGEIPGQVPDTKVVYHIEVFDKANNRDISDSYTFMVYTPLPTNTPTYTNTPDPNRTSTPTATHTPDPNATATPTPTISPTPTITPTPTPYDPYPPHVYVAGYADTRLDTRWSGVLRLWAYIPYDDVGDRVQMGYEGVPIELYLNDSGWGGDIKAGDKLYTFTAPIAPGAPRGMWLINIIPRDRAGNIDIWPYLIVR